MGQLIKLKKPDDSIEFFKNLKIRSEEYWKKVELDKAMYGFQTQKNTRWNKGLTEEQIESFESEIGIKFPPGLRNYYRLMNGVDLPAINIFGSCGEKPTYSPNFYSYPNDLESIRNRINWIYEANNITVEQLDAKGISKIFPVFGHRFVLIDSGQVLSMFGNDIIYWTTNISKLLVIEIFKGKELPEEFKDEERRTQRVEFWLDEVFE